MAGLILKFTDISGQPTSVIVDRDRFIIGRHSECELCIVDSRLSREHLLVETHGGDYLVTDRGSSNGTELNGERVFETTKLRDGDELNLGGFKVGVEIRVEEPSTVEAAPIEIAAQSPQAASPVRATPDTGISKGILIAGALVAGGILLVLGILVIFSLTNRPSVGDGNLIRSTEPDDESMPVNRSTPKPTVVVIDPPANGANPPVNSNSKIDTLPPTTNLSETAKVELNAASFLRKIAQNNPKAFVTGEQATIIGAKIKSVSGQPALADNISSAIKNAAAIKALAISKNLKPQFLAVAAIASLGSTRGDVLQAAQKMADPLDKLGTQVGNEFADDCLLMIAAYDQGDPMKMRNMLQDLATKATESSRTIRTIWYLKKVGKITDGEYDLALRFLAIGTITQNPRDFSVNTESLNF